MPADYASLPVLNTPLRCSVSPPHKHGLAGKGSNKKSLIPEVPRLAIAIRRAFLICDRTSFIAK
jgi:hypothetical protein